MFTSPTGEMFTSRKEYVNSINLDTDLIMLYLWRGERTPQNKEEQKWKEELEAIRSRGETPEFNFD